MGEQLKNGNPLGSYLKDRHPVLGPFAFEYSAFAVDGRPDLSMGVYNPADASPRAT
jgi:hypothetical protein